MPRLRTGLAALALLAQACGGGALEAPAATLPAAPAATATCAADDAAQVPAEGTIRAAYPDEPGAWHPAFHGDAASIDLSALWGLPLYSYDEAGQLRPELVRSATVLEGRTVALTLCPGFWSDGAPVGPADVVATIEALRTSPAPWLVSDVQDAVVVGEEVRVTFTSATGRWQHVLAELGTMLPADVLASDGLEAWRDDVPVSGGAWTLSEVEPGAVRRFVAAEGSALGAPAQQGLDVLVVPRFELALGLLVEDRIDVALGHLALEAGPRIDGVEERALDGTVARGNTLLTWQWNDGTAVTDTGERRAIQDGIDLRPFAEGLLTPEGDVARSFVPGVEGPPVPDPERLPAALSEIVVSAARWHDLPALVARGARDSLERRGLTVRTASDEADVLARAPLGDATIAIRRLGPWPSLEALWGAPEAPADLTAADQAPSATGQWAATGAAAVWLGTQEVPLVDVGVAHAWADLTGIRPSGWPGVGFTSAKNWLLRAN